jgi:D-alanyl-D-alanine carboxypeptidase
MILQRRKLLQLGLTAPLFANTLFAHAATKADNLSAKERLDKLAKALVMEGKTAGIAIGYARTNDGVNPATIVVNAGFANLETKTLVTNDTKFRIASVTKQFTAAAILRLAEQGALKVTDKLAKFLPDFPKASDISLHQLLTHTSGLHDYTWGGLPAGHSHNFAMEPKPHTILAKMNPLWDFDIGTQYNYSNSGYLLLGEIIEIASGMRYAAFLDKQFFKPLGMTGTQVDDNSEIVVDRASGYDTAPERKERFGHADFSTLPFSAGAVRSTATDLMKWSTALHGGRAVAPASLAEMRRIATIQNGKPIGEARYFPPNSSPGTPPAFVQVSDYGYGLEISRMFERRIAWHSGGINGFNALLFHGIDSGVHLAVLTNTRNGAVNQFEAFARMAALGE